MATSRTGTAKWKRVRQKSLATAWQEGQSKCLECHTELDWSRSLEPNSPEPDHIIPFSKGGPDSVDNVRIICRRCNQRLGGKDGRVRSRARVRVEVRTVDLDSDGIF